MRQWESEDNLGGLFTMPSTGGASRAFPVAANEISVTPSWQP